MTILEIAQKAETLCLQQVSLTELMKYQLANNPNIHQLGELKMGIVEHGFKVPVIFDSAGNGGNGAIIKGNGATKALWELMSDGYQIPAGIIEDNGDWLVPVIFGVDSDDEEQAVRFSTWDNLSNLITSGIKLERALTIYDLEALAEQVENFGQPMPYEMSGEEWEAAMMTAKRYSRPDFYDDDDESNYQEESLNSNGGSKNATGQVIVITCNTRVLKKWEEACYGLGASEGISEPAKVLEYLIDECAG